MCHVSTKSAFASFLSSVGKVVVAFPGVIGVQLYQQDLQ
ncbi:hypothetical protein GPEL0_01r2005 [Geoanaerobacter pelophilus]|uniref:Uncharacterized protein n=1 Tax=Geoanaerobacter pelophilus TaxID=60036 RepID=A0ABQ0MHL0_9BACT|nr:hypothetical protein GPEL0_01r2005 [Geoanaerobacter pelophilus]